MDYQQETSDRPTRSASGTACAEATPLDKLLAEFRDAKQKFDSACDNAAAALASREKCEGRLRGIANQLDRLLGKVLLDPTNPKIATDGPEQPPRF